MSFLYSLLQCVPNPRTGEFVTFGAIAGDPISNEWAIRIVENESHISRLAGKADIRMIHNFVEAVYKDDGFHGEYISNPDSVTSKSWLHKLFSDNRNIIQLSEPLPFVASDVNEVLDLVFKFMITQPKVREKRGQGRDYVLSQIMDSYEKAKIKPELVHQNVKISVRGNLETPLDFAIANGSVVQLSQAWSFQQSGKESIIKNVRSWALGMNELRFSNDPSYLYVDDKTKLKVDSGVNLAVITAPPITKEQSIAYKVAQGIFKRLEIEETLVDSAEALGENVSMLLGASA